MKVTISGVKIKNRTATIEMTEKMEDGSERIHSSIKCDQLVHTDFITAMQRLKIHLVKLCYLQEGKDMAIESFDQALHLVSFSISGISVGGSDENEGVTITGQQTLPNGKILNLNSPFTKYAGDSEDYAFGEDLALDVAALLHEADLYLNHGKYAAKEPELFDGLEDQVQTTDGTEKKKKRGPKKKKEAETTEVKDEEIPEVEFEDQPQTKVEAK